MEKDYIEMMKRCRDEILQLRGIIEKLAPKAHAYDSISSILNLLPVQSVGMSEDMVWRLNREIAKLETSKE